jgi:hypothetical protein
MNSEGIGNLERLLRYEQRARAGLIPHAIKPQKKDSLALRGYLFLPEQCESDRSSPHQNLLCHSLAISTTPIPPNCNIQFTRRPAVQHLLGAEGPTAQPAGFVR